MELDEYLDRMDGAFARQKARAKEFIFHFNAGLPSRECPGCRLDGHVPGLPCPECGYVHPVAWVILLDTEWGYAAVAINARRHVVASFHVE